jgi:2-amino-4-hydroxy-6-hydroxymethyldihydropteridine diphosphokinase
VRLPGRAAPEAADWTVVGLGGNLGGEEAIAARLVDATARLEELSGASARRSPLYRSAPQGPVAAQPTFVNAVVALPWQPDDPAALLAALLAIEAAHGRRRDVSQGPRTLDLDLILVGRRRITTAELVVPHPRLVERAFVLRPLADLVGHDFALPDGSSVGSRLAAPAVAAQSIDRLG